MNCTGHRYPINPYAPEEGTDIRHDVSCVAHGVVVPYVETDIEMVLYTKGIES